MGLAVIAILIALLLPAVRFSGEAARRSQCVNNLKYIGLALYNYEHANKSLPPAYTVDAGGRPLHSWRALILPYLEQPVVYNAINFTKPWDDASNTTARNTKLTVFQCPSSTVPPSNTTAYLAITARGGCFLPTEPRRLADIIDGASSTLMVIEASDEDAVPWMAPRDADEWLVLRFGSTTKLRHVGGVNALFVDGAVRFLKATIPAGVRRALISVAGDEDISSNSY